jgi:drug/metabolite transporter (DMT)-like permease
VKPKEVLALVLLAAVWGAPFLFYRVTAPELGPIVVVFLRVLLAGGALAFYARLIGREAFWRPRWRSFLVLGALNAAIPYTLIASDELHLTASLAAILNATTPLFTAVVAVVWMKEHPSPRERRSEWFWGWSEWPRSSDGARSRPTGDWRHQFRRR